MRVCVVGAGVSGLPSIKACLEEELDVVCYERSGDIGGLWNFRPHNVIGGTVMRTTVLNTSKEMNAYSDYPPDESLPNFMHNSLLLQYLREYAEKFDLLRHIKFNTAVKMITETGDGRWRVELEKGHVEMFDRLMLCTGHHADPKLPELSDISRFKGKVMHSHDYTDCSGLEGKVTISTRSGAWIFNRVSQGGMPYDTHYYTRLYDWLLKAVPWTVANDFMEHRLNTRMDHEVYGLRPNHRFFQQPPRVNDALANLLCSGLEDVESFTCDSVIVKGGRAFPCDVFITCTGYTYALPYLQEGIIPIIEQAVDLYKNVFPVERDDVAVIGYVQPILSIAPMSEMQARWSARVFAEKLSLPSAIERTASIAQTKASLSRRLCAGKKHTLQVDYLSYMDDLAKLIGCHPNPKQYLFADPLFALRLITGPNAPYVYRLGGPHKWSGARAAVEGLINRVKRPLKNRECYEGKSSCFCSSLKWIAICITLLSFLGFWSFFCFSVATVLHPIASVFLVATFLCFFSFLLL